MTERYYDDKLQAWVTVCPPGAALGADDLKAWGHCSAAWRQTKRRGRAVARRALTARKKIQDPPTQSPK